MSKTPPLKGESPQQWSRRVLANLEAERLAKIVGREPTASKAPHLSLVPLSAKRERETTSLPRHISAAKRGECEWCGAPARGGSCLEHDDLGHLHPAYNPEAAMRRTKR